jgi:hypothetical protein
VTKEQKWKLEHSERTRSLSFVTYVCCCKCGWPKVKKWFDGQDPCPTILFKPKIVTKFHTSNDNLSALPGHMLVTRNQDAIEEMELVTILSHNTPQSRRAVHKVVATDKH